MSQTPPPAEHQPLAASMAATLALSSATDTLAKLIERLAAGVDRLDEHFIRHLAAELHAHADRIELPLVEARDVCDVLVNFAMDRQVRLVVTAALRDAPGELTLRWHERDFTEVPVRLLERPRAEPYTFATVDYQHRGAEAELLASVSGLPAGSMVTVRALATVGDRTEWRVQAQGIEICVPFEGLALADRPDEEG